MQRSQSHGVAGQPVVRLALAVFLTLNVLVFTMALWTQDVYGQTAAEELRLDDPLANFLRYITLLLSLPVVGLLSGPLIANVRQNGGRGGAAVDLLLLLGIAASFGYSAASVFREAGHVYFEVGCVVLVLVTLGRWLEAAGKLRANEALEELAQLLPGTARRLVDGCEQPTPLDALRPGDWVRVLPGERIPLDGRVVRGLAAVDQQIVSGESQPVTKRVGDQVIGGALNLDGRLVIEATAAADEGLLRRMIDSVREARLRKGGYQQLSDRAASWFLPTVAALAVAAFVWHAWHSGFERALFAGLAVLLIACPCALGLATPLAIWTAFGAAAKRQVLFRSGDALERLAKTRAVLLDKTGTVTTGSARLDRLIAAEQADRPSIATLAIALARSSTHPLSKAIVAALAPEEPRTAAPDPIDWGWECRSLPGRGVLGWRWRLGVSSPAERAAALYEPAIRGGDVAAMPLSERAVTETISEPAVDACLGNLALMAETGTQIDSSLRQSLDEAQRSGQPTVCLAQDGRVLAVLTFAEEFRPEAPTAIAALRSRGLHVEIVTGDHRRGAEQLGQRLNVAAHAELQPEDKVDRIRAARRQFGVVAMVGDGINDAPALAAADVGLAMASGADVSRESADICLLADDLSRIGWAIELAQSTMRIVRQNLFWSLAYNMAGIGLAMSGMLNPIWASAAMVISSLMVIANSLLRISPGESAHA